MRRPGCSPEMVGIAALSGSSRDACLRDTTARSWVSLEGEEAHGSGRSIAKFHLLDALDAIHAANPGLLRRYGGHAVAVGAGLDRKAVPELRRALVDRAGQLLTAADLIPELRLDAA